MAIISWDHTLRGVQEARFQLYEERAETTGLFGAKLTPLRRYTAWQALLTWPPTTHSEQLALRGFLSRLIGGYDVVNMPIFDQRAQRGTKSGTVTFSGDHALGATTWTITGGSGQLVAGDLVQPNTTVSAGLAHAYIVRQGEDVLGANAISVWPPLRRAYSDTDSIVKGIAPGSGTWIMETMEIVGQLEFPPLTPAGIGGEVDANLYAPFAVEFQSALR